ncbi:ribonuclease p complex subunit [Niveomyces insectorum RCEF 264]|uniref:Ribonuclease p complex subunit n=1 Tax=Niveomyces insectorum RCEF 264 TaxID=1081102 RepID=A0A162JFM9_9HYPO|nr:ribonuclease p complex subunit [Niveomyces insectorum RCEF 264]
MLYDLSLVWTPSTTPAELDATLAMSAELGYDVVALDHVYAGAVPATITNPLPDLSSSSSSSTTTPQPKRPRVLRRATVVVSDTTVNHRLTAVAAAYDLLAVRPTTEKAFQAACLNMAEPALISLDLTSYFPFYFKHRTATAAVRRGVHFEVCYAQALRAGGGTSSGGGGGGGGGGGSSGTGNRARALFVANLVGLVRATRGRGLVVSSGSAGVGPLPRSIVANEGLRRRGFRGVVDVVQAPGGGDGQPQPGKKQQRQAQNQKGKQPQTQKQKQGQGGGSTALQKGDRKRKAEDGGEVAPQARQPPAADPTSKRQAKKQRKGIGS